MSRIAVGLILTLVCALPLAGQDVVLRWGVAANATSYQVEYRTAVGVPTPQLPAQWQEMGSVSDTTTTLSLPRAPVAEQRCFQFRVRGVNSAGFGAWAESATSCWDGPAPPPQLPGEITGLVVDTMQGPPEPTPAPGDPVDLAVTVLETRPDSVRWQVTWRQPDTVTTSWQWTVHFQDHVADDFGGIATSPVAVIGLERRAVPDHVHVEVVALGPGGVSGPGIVESTVPGTGVVAGLDSIQVVTLGSPSLEVWQEAFAAALSVGYDTAWSQRWADQHGQRTLCAFGWQAGQRVAVADALNWSVSDPSVLQLSASSGAFCDPVDSSGGVTITGLAPGAVTLTASCASCLPSAPPQDGAGMFGQLSLGG